MALPDTLRQIDRGVFWPAIVIAGSFVSWGVVSPDSLASTATAVLNWIIRVFGWTFVVSTAFFLLFAVFLSVSRFGKIKLGHDDETPEFSTVSWVCMMFSVGMGIGLMFWGVAEPIFHFGAPPHGMAQPQTKEAALVAMSVGARIVQRSWCRRAVVELSGLSALCPSNTMPAAAIASVR